MTHDPVAGRISRRGVLGGSLAATAVAAFPAGVFAGGGDRIRVGLVGCGGRGVGAALHAALAGPDVEVAAIGDLFADQVSLAADSIASAGRRHGAPLLTFLGPQAAAQVIAADVDLVILATPPHLRPSHAALAIRAGRHVFCEPPVAVDAAGALAMLAVAAEARARGLTAACGLHSRHHAPTAAAIARIHDGRIGRVTRGVAVAELGLPWRRPRLAGWTDAEHEQRNWIDVPRLSGGPLVEHHVHAIDRVLWAFGDLPPESVTPLFHTELLPTPAERSPAVAVTYRFADGRTLVAGIARREGIETRVEETVYGTRGDADLRAALVSAPGRDGGSPYESCMRAVIEGIRRGSPLGDLESGCRSTMAAILGRDAATAGVPLGWNDVRTAGSGGQAIQPLQSARV
ncbi:MAG: Gfo/Idh/MocA family oxidoreductase [Planctomycetes bacterium]|nr:Gfo/Idh/MocA family oxidoreductase [Planctomycetota bacterium]